MATRSVTKRISNAHRRRLDGRARLGDVTHALFKIVSVRMTSKQDVDDPGSDRGNSREFAPLFKRTERYSARESRASLGLGLGLRRVAGPMSVLSRLDRSTVLPTRFLEIVHTRRLTWYVAVLSTFPLTLFVARPVGANQRQEEPSAREFSPANSSSAQSRGLSTVTSKCPLGHFGGECQHSLKSFYFEHDVYGQF